MEMNAIHPSELWGLRKSGTQVELVDVRSSAEFDEMHAEIAWSVPLDSLDPHSLMKSRKGKPDDPLYFICQSGVRGEKAAQKLIDSGFSNVVNVIGGTMAWKKAGLPVVKVRNSISLERQVRIGAGSIVVLASALGLALDPSYSIISLVMGAGLVYAGISNWCGMALLLEKMPWNHN